MNCKTLSIFDLPSFLEPLLDLEPENFRIPGHAAHVTSQAKIARFSSVPTDATLHAQIQDTQWHLPERRPRPRRKPFASVMGTFILNSSLVIASVPPGK
jgi:hypothetical protein